MTEDIVSVTDPMHCAERFGTPCYLYNASIIKEQVDALKPIRAAGVDVHFSIKANPNIKILEYLKNLNINCEVSSEIELKISNYVGFAAEEIIFVGPGKTEAEIDYAIKENIKVIICESIDEVIKINALAKERSQTVDILLRINPDFQVKHASMRMSGVASQFGIDRETLKAHLFEIKVLSHVKIRGIQIYNATRILNADALVDNFKNIFQLSDQIESELELSFDLIDLGGGFGLPQFEGEEKLDIDYVCKAFVNLIEERKQTHSDMQIILELGRYLVGGSGQLITQVVSKKQSHGKQYLIIDAGMHCHFGMSVKGAFIQRNYPVRNISSCHAETECYQIAGPSCSPGDLVGRDVLLPKTNIGDYLVFESVGAYGLTAAPGRFISHGFAQEVLFNRGHYDLIRRKESILEVISTQI